VDKSIPAEVPRQVQREPIYIAPGDHVLYWASESLPPEDLRLMASELMRIADEKEALR
jgi:hypothetical protein